MVSADAGFLYDTYGVQMSSNIESIASYTLISLVMYSLTIITYSMQKYHKLFLALVFNFQSLNIYALLVH